MREVTRANVPQDPAEGEGGRASAREALEGKSDMGGRGEGSGFETGVDRAFNDVCTPPSPLFPHLGALKDFECDEEKVGAVWQPVHLRGGGGGEEKGEVGDRGVGEGDGFRKGRADEEDVDVRAPVF